MKHRAIFYLIAVLLGIVLAVFTTEQQLDYLMNLGAKRSAKLYNGWSTNLKVADNNQGLILRAAVARIGLGANTKEEAIYLTKITDIDGQQLSSQFDYEIIIEKELPVNAYWSITLYGADDFLIANEYDKYHVASFQNLEKREDGTTRILLSKNPPDNPNNWIPLPDSKQDLTLTLRCYNPQRAMLQNLENIQLPLVRRLPAL